MFDKVLKTPLFQVYLGKNYYSKLMTKRKKEGHEERINDFLKISTDKVVPQISRLMRHILQFS